MNVDLMFSAFRRRRRDDSVWSVIGGVAAVIVGASALLYSVYQWSVQ